MADFEELIEELERSYQETQERLSDPAVYNDHREAAEVGRRLKELEGPYKLAQEWRSVSDDLAAARADGDLRELVPELEERLAALEDELRLALVETDPADRKDVIVEIRQGVGGDEAALWAADVYRMLTRYAEGRGFKVEDLASSPNDGAGFKEVTFAVKGDGAFSVFKYEGGTHRVQRVPETESQGRIHTSTATVAVMPEAGEPLAYVLGEWGFRRLTLATDRRALVPRPETEVVVERCLALLAGLERPRVLDVGVGAGAIALAIAGEHPGARVTAGDVSEEALSLARENVERTGLPVELRQGGTEVAAEGWDLVVSNPPYVAPEELEALEPEIRDWEPRLALVGDGFQEELARVARTDRLVLEVAPRQAARVARALDGLGYREIRITRDLAGRERVGEGVRP